MPDEPGEVPQFPDGVPVAQGSLLTEDDVKSIVSRRARRQASFNFLWSKIGERVDFRCRFQGSLVTEPVLRAVAVEMDLKIPGEASMTQWEMPRSTGAAK